MNWLMARSGESVWTLVFTGYFWFAGLLGGMGFGECVFWVGLAWVFGRRKTPLRCQKVHRHQVTPRSSLPSSLLPSFPRSLVPLSSRREHVVAGPGRCVGVPPGRSEAARRLLGRDRLCHLCKPKAQSSWVIDGLRGPPPEASPTCGDRARTAKVRGLRNQPRHPLYVIMRCLGPAESEMPVVKLVVQPLQIRLPILDRLLRGVGTLFHVATCC